MDPNEADVPDAIEVECAINLLTDALCVAPVGTDVDALMVAVQQAAAQIRARQSRITELTRQRGVAEARVANLAGIITCAASEVRGAPVDGAEWAGREGELLDAVLAKLRKLRVQLVEGLSATGAVRSTATMSALARSLCNSYVAVRLQNEVLEARLTTAQALVAGVTAASQLSAPLYELVKFLEGPDAAGSTWGAERLLQQVFASCKEVGEHVDTLLGAVGIWGKSSETVPLLEALPRLVGAVRERDDAAKAAAVEYEQASARWHEDMCRVTRERDHTGKMVEVWRERCTRAREFQVLLHGIIVGMAAAVGEEVPQIPHMARIRLTSLDTPEVSDTTCKGSDDG